MRTVVERLKTQINEDCGCLEQEFVYKNIVVTCHVEDDGTVHITFDAGDWTEELWSHVKRFCKDNSFEDKRILEIMRHKAIRWINALPEG